MYHFCPAAPLPAIQAQKISGTMPYPIVIFQRTWFLTNSWWFTAWAVTLFFLHGHDGCQSESWLCQSHFYIIRNTFSLAKLKYEAGDSSVIYRSKMTHGKNKRNFQVFSPLEFVAAITQHIPEPSFQLARYYGWSSNRMRGDRKKQEERENGKGEECASDDRVIDIRAYKRPAIFGATDNRINAICTNANIQAFNLSACWYFPKITAA